jgi:hypothetical protein
MLAVGQRTTVSPQRLVQGVPVRGRILPAQFIAGQRRTLATVQNGMLDTQDCYSASSCNVQAIRATLDLCRSIMLEWHLGD